jgi:hypothetical protein
MFLREFERGGKVLCCLLALYPQSSVAIRTRHEANPQRRHGSFDGGDRRVWRSDGGERATRNAQSMRLETDDGM